jgi:hypothetical protein
MQNSFEDFVSYIDNFTPEQHHAISQLMLSDTSIETCDISSEVHAYGPRSITLTLRSTMLPVILAQLEVRLSSTWKERPYTLHSTASALDSDPFPISKLTHLTEFARAVTLYFRTLEEKLESYLVSTFSAPPLLTEDLIFAIVGYVSVCLTKGVSLNSSSSRHIDLGYGNGTLLVRPTHAGKIEVVVTKEDSKRMLSHVAPKLVEYLKKLEASAP